MPTVTTAPVPPTQTSCPSQGSVRTAITAPLAPGKDANIVYLVTEYSGNTSTSTLKRFDVTAGAKTEIVKLPNVSLDSPQISADGQWLLFVASRGQVDELQLVRMDGQCLQTLYCLPNGRIRNALWSSDQQKVLFSASAAPDGFAGLYLANIANGTIKQVLKPTTGGTLLIQVENFSQNHTVDTGQNGLWRVNTRGNDLTRLTTEANGVSTSLCQFSQNPWSNISRDGSMYAFETFNHVYPATNTLAFGRISGGVTQTFASISGTQLQMVGWTTM